ncbi:signal transduction histidine kinase [Thermocatellispora tengchongensis]|uniref:histidine kinase n=1 Tax=Thermocatellispora tengchongensis TaxID=1073253 RepID=A0A840NU87_9ACTN|nr:histidine kinase [Thermocatellispora tengchongensis]MBB5130822.1 signal transduction histidine kinase [Thermocatellispora tengchongensis]
MKRDVWLALGCLAGGLVLLAGDAYMRRGVEEWMLVPPLVAVCAAVAVRRRAPLVALGLGLVGISGDLVVGPSLGTVLVFTDNLYAATLYGPRAIVRWMLRITAVLAVVVGAGAWVVAGDWRVLAVAAVQAGLVLTTPVLTAVIIRQHREQAEAERTRAEQVARLAELDRRAAVNEERTRMARELHDLIANHFSAIAIQATGVLSRSDLDAATVRKVLESIRENGVQGMAEMRSMIQLLRQEGDDDASADVVRRRVADVGELVERARLAGVEVRLEVTGTPRDLPAAVDLAGYRIVQEALTNVLKHGDGREASVIVEYRERSVVVAVANPVRRAGAPGELPGAGAGIVGMRERAALVGGTLEAGPCSDGWRVRGELPLQDGGDGLWGLGGARGGSGE